MSVRQAELIAACVATVAGLFFALFSIPIFWVSIGSAPGAGVFPFWLGVAQAVCGLMYLGESLKLRAPERFLTLSGQEKAWLWQSSLSILAYVALMPALGFPLATLLLLAFHLRALAGYSVLFSVLFAAVSTAACWYFFGVLLYMPFPRGFVGL